MKTQMSKLMSDSEADCETLNTYSSISDSEEEVASDLCWIERDYNSECDSTDSSYVPPSKSESSEDFESDDEEDEEDQNEEDEVDPASC
jgi:hypothetical protein